MRYSARQLSALRTGTVLVFLAGMLSILGLLYVKFGGPVPGVTGQGYKLAAQFTDIQNLVTNSDVEMAGVPVGKVQAIAHTGGHEVVTMVLHQNAPVHGGAGVQIRAKTLLNETYVQLTDGNGKALASGSQLGPTAVSNETTLNDVLNTLNPAVRSQTAQLIQELQASTAGRGEDINQIIGGLGDVGRSGRTVFDVLAAQTTDLQQLVKQTATLMGVLDEGQGQIAQLVTSAQQVNQTTAAASSSVAATIASLPPLMQQIQGASGSVQTLSSTIQPIAVNLQAAAPDFNHDLQVLPGLTTKLRALNPTLQATLVAAPATLGPVRTTAMQLDQLNPSLAYTLSELDPMVAYMAPYRADVASFIDNFGATAAHRDCATCSTYTVAEPLFNANSSESANIQPGVSANSNRAPGTINGTTSSPQPAPPSYTNVQRLRY